MTALVRSVPCRHPPLPRGLSRALLAAHTAGTVVRGLLLVGVPLALFAGAVAVSPVVKVFAASKNDIATATVKKYAYDAYQAWRAVHAGAVCPQSLGELNAYMNIDATLDPWGSPYAWYCVGAVGGAGRVIVMSAGEDGRDDTADDVRSDR